MEDNIEYRFSKNGNIAILFKNNTDVIVRVGDKTRKHISVPYSVLKKFDILYSNIEKGEATIMLSDEDIPNEITKRSIAEGDSGKVTHCANSEELFKNLGI